MTQNLKNIFVKKLSKQAFQSYFYEELIELIHDEDMLVRIEALEVSVELMQTMLK
jgi:hypothetical protein